MALQPLKLYYIRVRARNGDNILCIRSRRIDNRQLQLADLHRLAAAVAQRVGVGIGGALDQEYGAGLHPPVESDRGAQARAAGADAAPGATIATTTATTAAKATKVRYWLTSRW